MPIDFSILNQSNQDNNPNKIVSPPMSPSTPSSSGSSGVEDGLQGLSGLFSGIKNALGFGGSRVNTGINNPTQQAAQTAIYNPEKLNATSGVEQVLNSNNASIWGNASKELGFNSNDPTLRTYLQKANPELDPTKTPWCAGFVGSVLNASGIKGTGSLAAKSYLNFGTQTTSPSKGDIVVFNDLTGRNDPAHGHVGFVDSIDSQKGLVRVLGGNQDGSVSIKDYPISKVAGFRKPPTGEQVQQFAKIQGIQDPRQLSNLTKQMDTNDNLNSTTQVIAGFEDFTPKAAWDVNAYRAGYGSDTTTLADGRVVKITPGMVVSKEDALRDLNRRTMEFQNHAISEVGSDNWNKLPASARTALTSMTYNYGSLPKDVQEAVRSGSLARIAGAIRAHGADNKGVNRERRYKEAAMVYSPINPTESPVQIAGMRN